MRPSCGPAGEFRPGGLHANCFPHVYGQILVGPQGLSAVEGFGGLGSPEATELLLPPPRLGGKFELFVWAFWRYFGRSITKNRPGGLAGLARRARHSRFRCPFCAASKSPSQEQANLAPGAEGALAAEPKAFCLGADATRLRHVPSCLPRAGACLLLQTGNATAEAALLPPPRGHRGRSVRATVRLSVQQRLVHCGCRS